MSVSQFIQYSSGDASGPGAIQGVVGDVLRVLDLCLVNGYSGKAAAGWSKPFANSGNIGCYQNGTGSTGLGVVINDNGPNATSLAKEAWATGWESIAGIGAPVGTGTGQFPTAAQLLTTGHTVIRKSTSADATHRNWTVFADAHTAYLLIQTGDGSATTYSGFMFGDVFSLKSTADNYRCMIIGNPTENAGTAGAFNSASLANAATAGNFLARTYGGGGASVTAGKHGDGNKSVTTAYFDGLAQTPNGPDNSYYLCPIWVHEPSAGIIRGRLRGVYQLCHPKASFSDGQTFNGMGDYAGKTFQVVRDIYGPASVLSHMVWETSNTVETN